MTPDTEALLIKDLGKIQGRLDAIDARLERLEDAAEVTGRHELARTQARVAELESAERAARSKWRDRGFEIVKLVLAGFVGFLASLIGRRM